MLCYIINPCSRTFLFLFSLSLSLERLRLLLEFMSSSLRFRAKQVILNRKKALYDSLHGSPHRYIRRGFSRNRRSKAITHSDNFIKKQISPVLSLSFSLSFVSPLCSLLYSFSLHSALNLSREKEEQL